ncbi:acyltransferase family protein [Blautia wexlerae]|uniref:acyltransferase family protein n=1 Tax=Blautia wexlerae TaxID=418240 RepID=UPI0034A4907E
MLTDIVLIDGVSRSVSPLWSLTWEVLFSLLLPVYIVVARRLPVLLQIVIAIAASTVGFMFTIGALQYLPMFAIGVALATGWQRIDSAARRFTGVWGALAWAAVIVVASLMTISYWLLLPITGGQTRMIALPTSLVGITMLIVAAVHAPLLRAILSTRVLVFLGTISFSLYLVHEPIVIAIGNMVPHASLTLVLAAPISLAVAVAFYYAIERPAHRLAQRVRRAADRDESAFAENGLVVSGPEARAEADAPRRAAP